MSFDKLTQYGELPLNFHSKTETSRLEVIYPLRGFTKWSIFPTAEPSGTVLYISNCPGTAVRYQIFKLPNTGSQVH